MFDVVHRNTNEPQISESTAIYDDVMFGALGERPEIFTRAAMQYFLALC